METSGYHTPKKSRIRFKKFQFPMQNNSPTHEIQRRESFIPGGIRQSFNNNNDMHKESASTKKKRKRIFSGDTIPEEKENEKKYNIRKTSNFINKSDKTKKEEINNDYFNIMTKSVFTNESHLNKNCIIRSPRKTNNNSKNNNKISVQTLFNNTPRRKISSINNDCIEQNLKNRKNTDNINLNANKDGLTFNSNYKVSGLNRKLLNKIDELMQKKKITKDEAEFALNYYENYKIIEGSPKHRVNNDNCNSPKVRKKLNKNKNNNVKFKEKTNSQENEKIESLKTLNEQDNTNNKILNEIIPNKSKLKWFNFFLCCLKTN